MSHCVCVFMCVHAYEFTAEAAALQIHRPGGSAHPSLPSPRSPPPPPPLHLLSSLLLEHPLSSRDFANFREHRAVYVVCVFVREKNWPGHTWTQQLQGGHEVRWIFLASRVTCVPVRHKSSSPLVVFELFSNNPPPAGLHLALRGSCVDSHAHPSLLRDRPTPFPPAPHPHLRQGCPAPRPCAEEALAGSSMGAVLAGIPTTPSTTDLPPPRCPTETGAPPSPADGRRH